MIVAIHQPEHWPWLGFLDKTRQSDVLVLLDNTQFRKNYFQNRNRIRGDQGAVWLMAPVITRDRSTQLINDVRIDNRTNPRWREKCWASIKQYYQQTDYWPVHGPAIEGLYAQRWERLVEMNEAVIHYLLQSFSIKVKVLKSSSMQGSGKRGELLLALCQELGADVYLSGISGKEYLDLEAFEQAGVSVQFQAFHHPIYRQRYEPFIPCLSAIDLLLNYGSRSVDVLQGVDVPVIQELFT